MDHQWKFKILIPSSWFIQTISSEDDITYPGVYFSPVKRDFNDPSDTSPDEFLRITAIPVNLWIQDPQRRSRRFQDAKELLDALRKEQEQRFSIPGPPSYKRVPRFPFVNGVVEVESVATVDTNASLYWVVHNDLLYEIYVQVDNPVWRLLLLHSFKFIEL